MRFVSIGALSALLGLAVPAYANMVLNVSKSQQRLSVVIDGQELYRWPVSTGRRGYETPDGVFHAKSMNREWFSRQYEMTPMPWSVFFYQGYALHGTLEGRHLGRAVSHGCVRLDTDHASLLFALVQEQGLDNTKVVITEAPLPRLRSASAALIEEIERRVMARSAVKVAAAGDGGERAAAKAKPEAKPEPKPEIKVAAKPEIKLEVKPDAKLVEEVRVAAKADRAEVDHAVIVGERGDKVVPAANVVREDKQARADKTEVIAVAPLVPMPPAAPPEIKVVEPAKAEVTPPEPAPPKAPQLAQVEPTPDDAKIVEPAPADVKLAEPAAPEVKPPEPAPQEAKQSESAPQATPQQGKIAEPPHEQAKAVEPAPSEVKLPQPAPQQAKLAEPPPQDVKLPEPAPHRLAARPQDGAKSPQRAERRTSSSRGDEAAVLRDREAWLRGLAHKYGFERW